MRRIAATLTVVVALLFSAGSAWADADDGLAAFDRGDYATAFQEFLPLAEQGHAGMQSLIGLMYANGYGVPENDAEAVKWYRKAAEQGIADAQFNLGAMYRQGLGVSKNDAEAVKWWRKASEQGHAKAQFALGVMYANGSGVPEDYVKAHMWWSFSKAQGYKDAASYLDMVKEQMNTNKIAKAQALAAEMWEKINN